MDADTRFAQRHAAQDGLTSPALLAKLVRQGGCDPCVRVYPGAHRTTDPCPRCGGTGNRPRHMVEHAAYCGHEGAESVLGWLCAGNTHLSLGLGWRVWSKGKRLVPRGRTNNLGEWLQGLNRWATAPLRAAVAAGWAVAGGYRCDCSDAIEGWGCPTCQNTGWFGEGALEAVAALEAAEAWLECLCDKHERAWRREFLATSMPGWAPFPWWEWATPDGQGLMVITGTAETVPKAAVAEIGEPAVRAAICEALTDWALKEVVSG